MKMFDCSDRQTSKSWIHRIIYEIWFFYICQIYSVNNFTILNSQYNKWSNLVTLPI